MGHRVRHCRASLLGSCAERLNERWFEPLYKARTNIAARRRDYNEVSPQGSFGRTPPAPQ